MADIVYLGDDEDIYFPAVTDAQGRVVDITGAALYCDAKTEGGSTVAASGGYIDDGPNGRARARFTSVQTAAFTPAKTYSYDGRLVMPDGRRLTIGFGQFRTAGTVTPTP